MRRGAFKVVNFCSQPRSIPSVTDKKTRTSQTTSDITTTERRAIKETESCFLRGIRYFRATESSNMNFKLFSLFKNYVLLKLFIIFFKLDPASDSAFVLGRPVTFRAFCAFELDFFARAFCHGESSRYSFSL